MAQLSRRRFLKASSAATASIAAASVAAPAIAQSMPEIKWRLVASWPRSIDVPFGACETVAKYIAEATDNKFQIQLFAAGEIVPALQVLDAVQNGSVEMCHTATYYFIGKDPTWALFCAVPFGLNARQQNGWFYDGDGLKLMNEFGKKFNVYSLVAGNTGAQMGGWFRKEINTVEDLKGLKFRVGGWAGKTLQKLGVVPSRLREATSTRPSRKEQSMRRNGWARTTTRSSASTRLPHTITILVGGRGARPITS